MLLLSVLLCVAWLTPRTHAIDLLSGNGNDSGNSFHSQVRTLTETNFEVSVLVHPRPWLILFSAGNIEQQVTFLDRVLDLASVFEGFVDIGYVNASNDTRLSIRFGFDPSTTAAKKLGGLVVGIRADARGLGAHNRVSFRKWVSLPTTTAHADSYFKRLVGHLLPNFVDVLEDGEVAENFFRPIEDLGRLDGHVSDSSDNAPFVLYFSTKELRRPPPEYVDRGESAGRKKTREDYDDTDMRTSRDGEALTMAEVAANVPPDLALLSIAFVGRFKVAFVPRSEAALVSTFQVKKFPTLLIGRLKTEKQDEHNGSDGSDGKPEGEMEVSVYQSAMEYRSIQAYLERIAATAPQTRDTSSDKRSSASVLIQQVSSLNRQCRGRGPSTCLVLVANRSSLPGARPHNHTSMDLETPPQSFSEALRELEPLARELRQSVRLLWADWPILDADSAAESAFCGMGQQCGDGSRKHHSSTGRVLLRMGRELWKQECTKRKKLRNQQERLRQKQKQQQSTVNQTTPSDTGAPNGGSAGVDANDPFGTKAQKNGTQGFSTDDCTSFDSFTPPPLGVFLLNARKNRFSGFAASRVTELSPLRLRQFLFETARGLLPSFEVQASKDSQQCHSPSFDDASCKQP